MTLLESPLGSTRTTTKATPVNAPGTEGLADTSITTREMVAARYAFAVARIAIGFVFVWAFVDKLFGLDHATPAARAWINGGSPSGGYLKGVEGPFAGVFNSMAGTPADWLFMAGLLGIGVALMLGVGMRIAAASGALLLVLMWAASLPIATNPFLDDHLVYAVVLVGLALMHAGNTVGLGRMWSRLTLVRRFPTLI
jgi:thiosulfate dehydrogenase (quinone) large subunit